MNESIKFCLDLLAMFFIITAVAALIAALTYVAWQAPIGAVFMVWLAGVVWAIQRAILGE